jgi:hypothetical protein
MYGVKLHVLPFQNIGNDRNYKENEVTKWIEEEGIRKEDKIRTSDKRMSNSLEEGPHTLLANGRGLRSLATYKDKYKINSV